MKWGDPPSLRVMWGIGETVRDMWQMLVSCPSTLILPQPMAHGTRGGGRALMTILRALRQQLLINEVKSRFLTLMTLSPVL